MNFMSVHTFKFRPKYFSHEVAMSKLRRTLIAIERIDGVGMFMGLVGIALLFHGLAGKPVAATLWGNNFTLI